jgi:hypothetical protein
MPQRTAKPGGAESLRLLKSVPVGKDGSAMPRGGGELIQSATRRVQLASRVRVSSMNCSSPPCRNRASPLAMSSNWICIVVPLNPSAASEDQEIDPDRWCSHTACGQEAWCLVSQWVWNLRLELGHQVEPTPVRTTEFAPAIAPQREQAAASSVPATGYGPPTTATSWKTGRFSGQDFPLQPDGTLSCPAGQSLSAQERHREADGSLRVVSAASIRSVVLVRCVSSVNGRVVPPGSHVRSASCCIHWPSGRQRFSGETGASRRLATPRGAVAIPCAARALASLVARAAGSQCTSSNRWSRHTQALWHPCTFCDLARVGYRLTPPLTATGFFPLGPFAAPRGSSCLFSWLLLLSCLFWLPIPLLFLSHGINIPF